MNVYVTGREKELIKMFELRSDHQTNLMTETLKIGFTFDNIKWSYKNSNFTL